MKTIVGVDPSTKTGFLQMSESGNVEVEEEIILPTGMKSTIAQIQNYARLIVQKIPENSIVCVEGFAFMAKGQSVSLLYGIGFAIRFELEDADLEYMEVTPTGLKLFVAGKGKGNCKKEVMIKEVFKRWGYEHDSNNVIDAYALAQYAISKI
jgi:crossover junction endodeoxyribonuclease RuvC